MPDNKLRVYARGTAMVPNYEAGVPLHGGAVQRFHSHRHDPNQGPMFIDPDTKAAKRHGAFIKRVGEVIEVPLRAEYILALREKDLWPADVATAQAAGVPFDPTFGGEHDAAAKESMSEELDEVAERFGTKTEAKG